jgi:hypothetical protein
MYGLAGLKYYYIVRKETFTIKLGILLESERGKDMQKIIGFGLAILGLLVITVLVLSVSAGLAQKEVPVIRPASESLSEIVCDTINVEKNDSTGGAMSRNLEVFIPIISMNELVDAQNAPAGETRFGISPLTHNLDKDNYANDAAGHESVVSLDKICEPGVIIQGETTDCTITITNNSPNTAIVSLSDKTPPGLPLIVGSVVGAEQRGAAFINYDGELAGALSTQVNVAVDPLAAPFGYFPLSTFGIPSIEGVGDETITNCSVPLFEYAGESWSTVGMVSNGYVVVGGGTGDDVEFANSNLPDSSLPNNTLAPFWTDLNPLAGGNLRIGELTDGKNRWIVADWENVQNSGDGMSNSFQIWIGISDDSTPEEDIFYTYGQVTAGDGAFLTVGAENKSGTSGGTTYYDGTGTPPSPTKPPSQPPQGYAVDVFSSPGAEGETHVIHYKAKGAGLKKWTNCAEMTSNLFEGLNVACFTGETTHRKLFTDDT